MLTRIIFRDIKNKAKSNNNAIKILRMKMLKIPIFRDCSTCLLCATLQSKFNTI
jgi:hypothetical protein